MSRYHGAAHKGASLAVRAEKRAEAEERNARTPEYRRSMRRAWRDVTEVPSDER